MRGALPQSQAEIDAAVDRVLFAGRPSPLATISRAIYEHLYNHGAETLRDHYDAGVHITFAASSNASLRYLLLEAGRKIPPPIRNAVAETVRRVEPLILKWEERDALQHACKAAFSAIVERLRFAALALELGGEGRSQYHAAALVQFSDPADARSRLAGVAGLIERMRAALNNFAAGLDRLVIEEGQSSKDPEMVRARAADLDRFRQEILRRASLPAPLPSWSGLVGLQFPDSDPGYWLPE